MVVDIVLEDKFCNSISPVSGYVYIEDIILGSLHAELAWSFHPGLSLLHECFFDHAWFRRKLQVLKNIRSSVQPWRDPGNIIYEYFKYYVHKICIGHPQTKTVECLHGVIDYPIFAAAQL